MKVDRKFIGMEATHLSLLISFGRSYIIQASPFVLIIWGGIVVDPSAWFVIR